MAPDRDDPRDWVRVLTPPPAEDRRYKTGDALEETLTKIISQGWRSLDATPPKHIEPLPDEVIHFLKEQRNVAGETLYDAAVRLATEPIAVDGITVNCPQELTEQLIRLSLKTSYVLAKRDILVQRHADGYTPGDDLMTWWDITEDILRGYVLAELPVFKMSETEMFDPLSPALYTGGSLFGSGERDPLSSPRNWWFKRDDVDFYMILHPEICGYVANYDSAWITPELLAFLWKVELSKLLDWSRTKGLRPWKLTRQEGLRRVSSKVLCLYGFNGCLFKADDLRAFIQNDPTLGGLKKLQGRDLDRFDAINYAQDHWKIDPTMSKRALAAEIRDRLRFREPRPQVSTIEAWIQDVNPRRKENQRKHNPKTRGKALRQIS